MYPTISADPLILLMVQATMWALAGVRSGTVRFGVRVPPEHADGPTVQRARRVFRVGILANTVVALPMMAFVGVAGKPILTLLVIAATVAADVTVFAAARHIVATAKSTERWYAGRRQMTAADTALRTSPPRPPWSGLAQPLLVIAATVIVGIWRYPHLPATLVLHFDASGNPDHVVATSVGAEFLPVVEQLVLTAIIIAVAAAVQRMPADLDPADLESSAQQARVRSDRLASAVLTLGMCTNVSLGLLALQEWVGGSTLRWPLLIGALTATFLGLGFVVFAMIRGYGTNGVARRDRGAAEPVWQDDDRHWRGGLIYRNPEDPKLLVPKRFGIGLTFNFAHPMAWVSLAVLIALPIASFLLAAIFGG